MNVRAIQDPPVRYNGAALATTTTVRSNHPMTHSGRTRTEIAQLLFDAFNSRELDATLALLHPEIVFEPVSGAVLNDGEPYRGHEGMRRYYSDVQAHWRELTVDPSHLREAGNAVVALGHVSGASDAGVLRGAPTTWVFKFKDDLVTHIQVFSDQRLAREALGL
jgi:ketosteroid isomerase-like protein